ncbi:MAG: DUF1549 domain-containing protein, partial [Planctomycetota bacterium]
MPHKAAPLAAGEIETIRRWIDAGAQWPDEVAGVDERRKHWAYQKPMRPVVPQVEHVERVRNAIDAFLEARFERDGVKPAPEASRETLVRRLHLDLTGIPPTPEEVAAFENDTRADAYAQLVKKLLASSRYGERMARPWLDLARYADTQGYEKDARRSMAPYRDWVIAALNSNMSFDRFSIEQLAGDLLPNATRSQRIATAFHRNTMLNEEGGTDAEEFRSAAVIDRVNTTATIWMGSTLACAQCHDHKYDPFAQRDYYRLFAALNQTADGGKTPEPVLRAPTAEQERELEEIAKRIEELERKLTAADEALDKEQREWEAIRLFQRNSREETKWSAWIPTELESDSLEPLAFEVADDGTITVTGAEPDRVSYTFRGPPPEQVQLLRLDVLPLEGEARGPGRASHGNFVLSELEVAVIGDDGVTRVHPNGYCAHDVDFEQRNGPFRAANSVDGDLSTGWAVGGATGSPHFAVFRRFSGNYPVAEFEDQFQVRLRFESPYPRHALGRLRISTGSDSPT